MPEIKICGLTRLEEADYVAEAGADYAGFVMYYPKSKRNVYPHSILPIKERLWELNPKIKTVAVTVSPTIEQLEAVERMQFDYIQIHGELKEEVLKRTTIPIFRAYNFGDIMEKDVCWQGEKIQAVVFDGKMPGSGETFDWSVISGYERNGRKLMLAGGLNTENVEDAIRFVKPDIVDVSSGVEAENGLKDREKIKAFVEAVRRIR